MTPPPGPTSPSAHVLASSHKDANSPPSAGREGDDSAVILPIVAAGMLFELLPSKLLL